jgi:arsenite/tail-anchored protein-transporting ATPase
VIVLSLISIKNDPKKRFILVGGKGGTGKTSTAASLATEFAKNGEKTLIISTDPAHSISDSFDFNLTGGKPVRIEGYEGELYGLEINTDDADSEFSKILGLDGEETDVSEFMETLKTFGFDDFGEVLGTAPPGIDEAVALANVIKFIDSEEYKDFSRFVFDTAPTGHTLRLLSLPDFLDTFIVKAMKARNRVSNLMGGFKTLFGAQQPKKTSDVDKLELFKLMIIRVREFFQDENHTEFVVVTIPTVMSINESERLVYQLKQNHIAVNNIVVNQIMPENLDCSFCTNRANNQKENLVKISEVFADFELTKIQYFDHEVRGTEYLTKMGSELF